MNSLPTRCFCALMSMVGTAGLVAFASPAIAVGNADHARTQPATTVAAVFASPVRNG